MIYWKTPNSELWLTGCGSKGGSKVVAQGLWLKGCWRWNYGLWIIVLELLSTEYSSPVAFRLQLLVDPRSIQPLVYDV